MAGRPDFSSDLKVYDGPEWDAAMVKLALEQNGIAAVSDSTETLGSRHLHSVIFVRDPEQIDRAREIVAEYLKGHDAPASPSWRCPTCREVVEGQFLKCWKCGHARPD